MRSRKVNTWILLTIGIAANATLALGFARAGQPFTFVALPDTQNYTKYPENRPLFSQQTQWIADQIQQANNPRNIQFVSHLGDIVNYGGSSTQWQVADGAMDLLDGVVKYSVLPGNHDYQIINQKSSGTENYLANFGPDRFADRDWFGGADLSGNNSYQRFTAGGYDFLHLTLEWRPAENFPVRATSPIAWAQSVLDANPHTPVILSTHENLADVPPRRSIYGEDLWNQLVKKNDQVFMVLNGHYQNGQGSNDGEYHQISTNDAGRPVFEVLQNFQDYPNGGDGWLRLINFDIPNNQVAFETYSPVLDQFQTERVEDVGQYASQFEFGIDFSSRLQPIVPPPTPDLSFQNGHQSYWGTRDKELRSSGNDLLNGQFAAISVDGNDGTPGRQPNHGLIRFEDFMGTGPGQLSPDARIDHAVLVLEVFNAGSGFTVHEMLADWDENSTWQEFGAGIQANGVEASSTSLAQFGTDNNSLNVPVGRLEIDVTSTLEAYQNGSLANFGWALLPFIDGDNGVDFFTSEYSEVDLHPSLQVFLSEPTPPGDFDLDGNVDGADFLLWQRGSSPTAHSATDLAAWKSYYSTLTTQTVSTGVPEPAAGMLLSLGIVSVLSVLNPTKKRPRTNVFRQGLGRYSG